MLSPNSEPLLPARLCIDAEFFDSHVKDVFKCWAESATTDRQVQVGHLRLTLAGLGPVLA